VICLSCGVGLGRSASNPAFETGDLFYRLAGGLMILSGLWNFILAVIFFISLIIACVGIFWLVPALLALIYMLLGIGLTATGNRYRLAAFLPVIGFGISLMNFNVIGLLLDASALALGVIGFIQNRQDE